MSSLPPDGPTPEGTGPTPPSGPDDGAPPSGGGYGAPPPGGGYGAPPPGGGYGAPPPPGAAGWSGGVGGVGEPSGAPEWSIGEALGYGWSKFTENLAFILMLGIILVVGIVFFGIAGGAIQAAIASGDSGYVGRQLATGSFSLLEFLISTILGAYVVRGALDITEGRPLELGSIFARVPLAQVIVLAVITAVVTAIGFVLCFLPGLVALLFFYFASYFLIDKNLSAVDAIRASVDLVRGNLGNALGWAIVAFLVSIVGACLCVIGLVVTYPVAIIGTAYTYKRLTGQSVVD